MAIQTIPKGVPNDSGVKFKIGDSLAIAQQNDQYLDGRINGVAKTPYEFGWVDGGVDASSYIQACENAYGECYLTGGVTYNLQHQVNVRVLKSTGGRPAVLNLTSPTGDGKWGGPASSFGNTAAVMCLGATGAPLEGADVQGIIVQCNGMLQATGGVGVKGFMFYKCKNFYQRSCDVYNCASYAFWDFDTAVSGTDYCSGTMDDCFAYDSAVSFEQVNPRGITLNNCHGYISSATLAYTPECIFHPYGGDDMQVVYNNCTGIADGVCPEVFAALLNCKNVTANDCQFINRYNGGASIQAAVYFEPSGGNFDRINFKNCILRADYWASVIVNTGALGSASASFSFTDCVISGKSIGVSLSGSGGFYSFANCITTGTSIGGATAYGYNDASTGSSVQITGGSAVGTGGASPQSSNLPSSSFNHTRLVPASIGPLVIRQQSYGSVVLGNNGTYASNVVALPSASLDETKVSMEMYIVAPSTDTAAVAAAKSYPLVFQPTSSPTPTNFRVASTNVAAAGLTVRYTITEYY